MSRPSVDISTPPGTPAPSGSSTFYSIDRWKADCLARSPHETALAVLSVFTDAD